jgi:hypothetical protein
MTDEIQLGWSMVIKTKLECGCNTNKDRDSYLLLGRRDMEMSPDSLEVEGVNELSVKTVVDEPVTTEQTVHTS